MNVINLLQNSHYLWNRSSSLEEAYAVVNSSSEELNSL